ncbi:hypothetical protein ACF0H5_020928 [Mactra antiquata]
MFKYFLTCIFFTIAYIRMVNTEACKSSTYGTDFYFGIMESIDGCCHTPANLVFIDITNVSPNNTDIRIQIPFLGLDTAETLSPGNKTSIKVDPSIQREATFVDQRGVRVTSNYSISVMVTNAFNSGYTIDTYNILPVASLGNEYIVASYENKNSKRGSELLVAGVHPGTNVTLINGKHVINKSVLQPFEVFQYRKVNEDLTGVRVHADNDVFVVAGAAFVKIPDSIPGTDYIASELYPISKMSKSFIVPPVSPKHHFILRILTDSQDGTMVTFRNVSKSVTINSTGSNASPTNVKDYYFETDPIVITSDQPIAVSQYGLSYYSDYKTGDAFMSLVPSIDQYVRDLKFSVPDSVYNVEFYMAIIVPKIYADGLILNSDILNSTQGLNQFSVPDPFDNYTILSLPTTSGYHHIYHTAYEATFCVLVLGIGQELSLGFYPGINLDGECPHASTLNATEHTTQNGGNIAGNESLQCFTCDDMTHLEICNTVTTCDDNEVCFVERQTLSGRNNYRSGCLAQEVCFQLHVNTSDICIECCNDHYCNIKGCGGNGFQDRHQRGPVCYDCQHVLTPDECTTVTLCDKYQVCEIVQYPWGDHSHFKMGCSYGLCEPLKRSSLSRADRSKAVCKSCCKDDFCNKDCPATKTTPNIIVG